MKSRVSYDYYLMLSHIHLFHFSFNEDSIPFLLHDPSGRTDPLWTEPVSHITFMLLFLSFLFSLKESLEYKSL